MIPSNIRRYFLINEAIKSVFKIIINFLLFFIRNKYARLLPISIVVLGLVWFVGLVSYKNRIMLSLQEQEQTIPDFYQKTDAIIVLTGTRYRLIHSFNLLGQGYSSKLFISGVNKDVKLTELLTLMGYKKEDFPKLEKAVELGYKAFDTEQNAAEVELWVKKNNIRSLRVVTSNYHMPRALFEIKDRLPDVKLVPFSVIEMNVRLDRWYEFSGTRKLLISEYNKFLLANVRVLLSNLKL